PYQIAPGLPFRGFTQINMARNEASSNYNSLQVDLNSQVKDLQLRVLYTYSRTIDPSTGGSGMDLANVSNPYAGWTFDVGPSVFDRTHVFFVHFVSDIPFLKNSSNKLLKGTLGGWQLSGIVTAMTGSPLNVSYGGSNVCAVISNCAMRPDLTGAISYPKTKTTLDGTASSNPTLQWFNPSAFTAPTAPNFGNLHYNALRGPGRDNTNLSLFKNFVINEERGTRFEFRAESF